MPSGASRGVVSDWWGFWFRNGVVRAGTVSVCAWRAVTCHSSTSPRHTGSYIFVPWASNISINTKIWDSGTLVVVCIGCRELTSHGPGATDNRRATRPGRAFRPPYHPRRVPVGWTGERYHLGRGGGVFDAELYVIMRAVGVLLRRQQLGKNYTIF